MNTLLCYCGFRPPPGSDPTRVAENTINLKTDANVSPAGGTSPRGLPSSPSLFPLTPRPEAPSPFLSPLHISKIPAHRSAFFTGLTTFFLFFHLSSFFVEVLLFFCPDTNFHTLIQGNGRNVSVPAASCCCCTYGHNRGARGARVFLQGPRMDGWIDTGIE